MVATLGMLPTILSKGLNSAAQACQFCGLAGLCPKQAATSFAAWVIVAEPEVDDTLVTKTSRQTTLRLLSTVLLVSGSFNQWGFCAASLTAS
eukprot:6466180-Amphidinium_carterae.1